jgi:hypothetical protein
MSSVRLSPDCGGVSSFTIMALICG